MQENPDCVILFMRCATRASELLYQTERCNNMGFLKGKTAIITGGGREVLQDGSCGSIGYGIATAFAKEGANLVLTGRNVKKLEGAKELEEKYGIKVLAVPADIHAGADNEAIAADVVKQAMDAFGRIDVLINNALAWTSQLEKFQNAYPDAFKANVKMPPMGHFGDVEKEIGRVCVQLASPDFKYMTGETITLEGGLGQRP